MTTMSHQHITFGDCRFVQVGEVKIHLIEAGTGIPLALIHGGQAWAYT